MNKRFFKLFNLTQEQAIALLDTPQSQTPEEDSRYIAASHLVNFSTEESIQALMRAVQQSDPDLENRIVRRKAVETLGRLQAGQAIPVIRDCLNDGDPYTVENAVWAIGEIGTQDSALLEEVAQLLEQPGQTYRVIIHTLAKLGYRPAVARIRPFTGDRDQPTASAAITAICRLTADYDQMDKVVALLQHPKVLARRLSIQDLMDAQYYPAIPGIARCPVSIVFRLRGIRALGESGIAAGALTFAEHVQPFLEQALRDHPSNLALVHSYAQTPDLPTAIRGLYDTDFGRCYLAAKTILDHYADTAAEALLTAYAEEARQDYGAHFHVVKLLGWLKHHPAYDLLVEALHNTQPQFQKSRAAAAIALGELGDRRAISELKNYLESRIWDLKYAALLALEKLGHLEGYADIGPQDDWLIREKATQRH